ncbi:DMT family transporter [Piscinibacter gummiphilus]|uniref:DMT family transporter n=1 Tax=Piscinibacter gummiphilus TaxID=946333 RepID=A0ABZ0CWZ4_9BURK|nr:DMT family transporter [Piscinibacter gummiphilus]WOB07393.1 DMT family transporter [Piscinibacter gummiphilus]
MQRLPVSVLFTVCVLVWSTTWYAITFQIGGSTPELGVALRFMLAGACVLAWRAARGDTLRFGRGAHLWFALQGVFLYGVSYICVYHAERYLPSGVVAVGYSASPLAGGIGAAWCFGTPLTRRFLLGGVLGLAGVALIFWPEFGKAQVGGDTALGVLFTAGSVFLSTVGSLLASRNGERGLSMWPSLGFGMLYGGGAVLLIALASGQSVSLPGTASWWIALLYLALAGSVLSFACYLTLLSRLGAGPAGTIGVMTPILALVVSTLFEGYRPDALAGVGVLLAVAGNVLILRKPAPLRGASPATE